MTVLGARRPATPTAVWLVAVLLAASGCGQTVEPEPAELTATPEPRVEAAEEEEPESEPEPVGTTPLTGVPLFDAAEVAELADRPATTVKIPNDPSARPQTGLEAADVVYEQETEAGVTRFAAVFHSAIPDVVGNVRSARHVDVPLVAPYEGIMVFSGARASVRGDIAAAGLTTVTEGGAGFYRDGARRAPHNLYTRLPQAIAARDARPAQPAPWTFDDQPPDGGRAVEGRVEVRMSRSATTGWEFDEAEGVFRRFQNGAPHTVTGSGVIGAANVVVLDVPVHGRDSHGAPRYGLEGSGDALLLRDGRAFDIEWAKAGRDGPLELRDAEDPARLAEGPTWVLLTYDGALTGVAGLG